MVKSLQNIRLNKALLALFGVFLYASCAWGQESKARAYFDSTRMLIGDQVLFNIELEQSSEKEYTFPLFQDSLVDKLEVLKIFPIDTARLDKSRLLLRQKIKVTSFDTGFYVVPRMVFVNKNQTDSIKTDLSAIEVFSFEVDTTKGIFDIKPPLEAKRSFGEILPYILLIAGLIGLSIVMIYIIKKRKNKESIIPQFQRPKEPAHRIALRRLDKLEKDKLWQQNKIKAYHSELSDIIRKYIEDRFGIPAMESTSNEILEAFEEKNYTNEVIQLILKDMLELADLVKFAKWSPNPEENENCLKMAYQFVIDTKLKEDLKEPKGENDVFIDVTKDKEEEEEEKEKDTDKKELREELNKESDSVKNESDKSKDPVEPKKEESDE